MTHYDLFNELERHGQKSRRLYPRLSWMEYPHNTPLLHNRTHAANLTVNGVPDPYLQSTVIRHPYIYVMRNVIVKNGCVKGRETGVHSVGQSRVPEYHRIE